jgi:hypothetical protein
MEESSNIFVTGANVDRDLRLRILPPKYGTRATNSICEVKREIRGRGVEWIVESHGNEGRRGYKKTLASTRALVAEE